jgi:hypothetical protein
LALSYATCQGYGCYCCRRYLQGAGRREGGFRLEGDQPLDFYTFRETLARQMLSYTPKEVKYLGDELFRVFTQSTKAKWAPSQPLPALIAEGAITDTTAGINGNALVTTKAK